MILLITNFDLHGQTDPDYRLQELLEEQEKQIRIVTLGALVPVVLLFAFTFFFFYRRKRESDFRQRELELKYAQTEMEMRALRAQVNPHFIFNCLSSIQHFIHHNDTVQAERYLVKFSRLIRQVLENSSHPFISLHDDIELIKLYVSLEAMRLQGGFEFQLDMDPAIDPDHTHVPPMLLQPLVENAVWHGLSNRSDAPRRLQIGFRFTGSELFAEVKDNGHRKPGLDTSLHQAKSFGLALIRERVALLSDMAIDDVIHMTELVDDSGQYQGMKVELKIPTEE